MIAAAGGGNGVATGGVLGKKKAINRKRKGKQN